MKKKVIIPIIGVVVIVALGVLFLYMKGDQKSKDTGNSSTATSKTTESLTSTTKESKTTASSQKITPETSQISNDTSVNNSESQPTVANDSTEEWKKTFEKSLYDNYGVTVSKYVDGEVINGQQTYSVYVNEVDTGDQPYVTVNSVTGDYHG